MQNDLLNEIVVWLQSFLGWLLTDQLGKVIGISIFLLVLYVIQSMMVRTAKVAFKGVGMPREAASGVVFFIRLIFFAVAFVAVLTATGQISGQSAVAITTLVGAAVGMASSRALGSLVSGIYLFGTRPFKVGDYVKIGDVEGIVLEITLNYTRLLRRDHTRMFIPNSVVLDSRLINYRIRVDDYLEERGLEHARPTEEENGGIRSAMTKLKHLAKGEEVYRYTFDVTIEGKVSRDEIHERFDDICIRYRDAFVEAPEYVFWEDSSSGPVYKCAYMVTDAKDIFGVGAEFQSEISHALVA